MGQRPAGAGRGDPHDLGYQVLGGSLALAVLMDAVAVAFVFLVLIEVLEPVSYCYFNPAVTLARMLTFSVSGLRRLDGLWFIIFECAGALAAAGVAAWFYKPIGEDLP